MVSFLYFSLIIENMQETIEKEAYTVHGQVSHKIADLVFIEMDKNKMLWIDKNLRDIDRKGFSKRIKHNVKGNIEVYVAFYLGYIHPDSITGYFCSKCNKEYSEKPLQEIFIDLPDDFMPEDYIGKFYLQCNHCDNIVLYHGMVKENDNVEIKNIVMDKRGLFIKKTKEDVYNKLEELLGEARKGPPILGGDNIAVVDYWAKNLGLDISKRLGEIENIREENYFNGYQKRLSETIASLENHADYVGNSHPILRDHHELGEELTYEEGSGFYEVWDEFVEYLPKLTFTPELKERTLKVLGTIKSNLKERNIRIKETIEEKTNELNEALNETLNSVKEHEDLEALVKSK